MLRSLVRCSNFNAFYSKESLFAAVNIRKGEKIIIKKKEENELDILNTYLEDKANTMAELLNPNSPGSIYAHLDDVKDEMGADDGPVAKIIDDAFEDKVQPLEALIIEISNYIKEQKGQSEAEANSPVKGGVFEDNVHIAVKKWVETLGGNATHTGPDNLPGDHVLMVPMPDDVPMRIVVEFKRDGLFISTS